MSVRLRKNVVLTAKQVAQRVGCDLTWLYHQLASGKLAATRNFRGEWQITQAAFDEWNHGYQYRRRGPYKKHVKDVKQQAAVTAFV